MVDKERCKVLYAELKRDIQDLESVFFREAWQEKLMDLKHAGCWWHYMLMLKKSRDYNAGKGDYPLGYNAVLREYKKQ